MSQVGGHNMASVASLLCSNQLDRKRSHDQMSNEFRLCNTHNHDSPNTTAQSSNSFFSFNAPSRRRDFDLRRPIMSQARRDIIDLTEDTSSPPEAHIIPPGPTHTEIPAGANRPPRFDRNIINVDEQEVHAVDLSEESPEIEFLTSRPRSRSLSASRRLPRRRPGFGPSPGRHPQIPFRATAEDRILHQPTRWTDTLHNIPFPRLHHSNIGRIQGDELIGVEGDFAVGGGLFQVPDNLNFLQAGFDYDQPSRPQQQQPRLPTYDPPLPAQLGFTRSPNEDDVLACPHCDDELGTGENEVKRQVWVVKACGHVYCGECATYRSIRQSSLASSSKRVKPWSKCVVEDCGKNVQNPKSIIQVYL